MVMQLSKDLVFLETESRQEGLCRSISSKKSCEDADQITDFFCRLFLFLLDMRIIMDLFKEGVVLLILSSEF